MFLSVIDSKVYKLLRVLSCQPNWVHNKLYKDLVEVMTLLTPMFVEEMCQSIGNLKYHLLAEVAEVNGMKYQDMEQSDGKRLHFQI